MDITTRQGHVLGTLGYFAPATARRLAQYHPLGMLAGTVRQHLAALADAGLVQVVQQNRPRVYDLTDAGRAELARQGQLEEGHQ